MSYLHTPRLTFTGNFQADVATVNNDPRHYDNATFSPAFHEVRSVQAYNGWWNPMGTGIFRLSGCTVQAAIGPDGQELDDPVVGFLVGNALERPSAKIVDLDPDWQLASQLYGLSISLIDPASGKVVLAGDFAHAPCRDLWTTRASGPPQRIGQGVLGPGLQLQPEGGSGDAGGAGDSAGSAIWQSVLTDLRWDLDGVDSPLLRALAQSSGSGPLSIRLVAFAFQDSSGSPMFTYGTLLGAIGPYVAGEPKTFIAGRRLMPWNGSVTAGGISCFSSRIDAAAGTLTADLGNALPLDGNQSPRSLGNVHFAVLLNAATPEGTTVDPDGYVVIGPMDQSDNTLFKHSGIQTLRIPAAARSLLDDHPLALVRLGPQGVHAGGVVVLREVPGGREVRADEFSFRLDPNEPLANRQTCTFYATHYGKPLSGAGIVLFPGKPQPDTEATPASDDPAATPKAPVPLYNTPAGVIRISPDEPVTGAAGTVQITFAGPKKFGAPRQYIDGQVYTIHYQLAGESATILQQFDQISILLFSSFEAPERPRWEDVQPILQQYANLYPVMSHGVFDFSRREVADANAQLLRFSLSKDVTDPGYMPVSRDLSAGKRAALLRYFEGVLQQGAAGTMQDPSSRFSSRRPRSR